MLLYTKGMIWQPTKLVRSQMEGRWRQGAYLLRAGKLTQAEIARELGVSRTAVSQWKAALEEKGMRGLRVTRSSGRPTKLSETQQQALQKILKRGARLAGYSTERWTLSRVCSMIRQEFDVVHHPYYVGRLMHEWGSIVHKPETRAIERDECFIRAWLSHDWERIKKSAAARGNDRVRG